MYIINTSCHTISTFTFYTVLCEILQNESNLINENLDFF